MPTKKPRIYVTFDPETFETLRYYATSEGVSMSACASRIIEDWVEKFISLSNNEKEKFLAKLRIK